VGAMRGLLDNLYLSNRPRPVLSDRVNLESFIDWVPSSPIRLKPGAKNAPIARTQNRNSIPTGVFKLGQCPVMAGPVPTSHARGSVWFRVQSCRFSGIICWFQHDPRRSSAAAFGRERSNREG